MLSVKIDIQKISIVQDRPEKSSLTHYFVGAFSSYFFVVGLLCKSSPGELNFKSFSSFSMMLNGIFRVMELTRSKFLDCRNPSTFLAVLFRTSDLVSSLKVATKLNTGMELDNSACCPNQADFLTKKCQKSFWFPSKQWFFC